MTGQSDPYLPPAASEEPPKRGMSPVLKVLLFLGGFTILGVFVCCGGMAVIGSSVMKMSPAAVDTVADEIVDIDVLPPWQGTMAMDMSAFGVPMRMAMYGIQGQDGQDMLMLLDMEQDAGVLDRPEQFERMMRQQIEQQQAQGDAGEESLRLVSSDPIQMQINGRPAHITLNRAVGEESGDKYFEVTALFMGAQRPAMLYLRANQQHVSRGEILAMLRSMEG
ncbi:MAG: hypothetical protein RIC55_16715 [Pirellulaceae bacterium]